ncbi:phage integrase N-terminal SAM-like domain-containing protein [Verrucomicrobiota bacterium sgz303538]
MRYATFLSGLKEKGRDQGLSSEAKFERFLTRIAKSGCAASTQNQAFNAVIFLYKEVIGKPLERVQAPRTTRPAHVRTCSFAPAGCLAAGAC